MRNYPELFQVDRKVAYAMSWSELFNLMKKIFSRTLHYFIKHELTPSLLSDVETKVKSKVFEKQLGLEARLKQIEKFNKREESPVSNKLKDYVKLFRKSGGFRNILEMLRTR